MEFFIPGSQDDRKAEETYQRIRGSIARELPGVDFSDRRIWSIGFEDHRTPVLKAKDYEIVRAEVGRPDPIKRPTVVAILECLSDRKPRIYLICTLEREVIRGPLSWMMVGLKELRSVEDFE